ncbi:MAG TPA: hypothetical protein VGU44_05430 [Gammaproteobacteria bacterium]|nr:hypothetical protein [Gammaproteobacteria bacterium]
MTTSTEEINALLKEVLSDKFDRHKSKWPEKFSQVFEATSLYVKLGQTKELYLKGANITDHEEMVAIVDFLNETPGIKILMLAGNKIKPADIKYLLDNCQAIQPGGTITSLNLAHNGIGDEGAAHFANKQTSLDVADLSCNGIGDPGAVHLATNPTIQHLNLGANKIGPRGAKALNLSQKTTHLNLESNEIGANPKQYFENHHFTVLELAYQRAVPNPTPVSEPKTDAPSFEGTALPITPEGLVNALQGVLDALIAGNIQNNPPQNFTFTGFSREEPTRNNSVDDSEQKVPMRASKQRKKG